MENILLFLLFCATILIAKQDFETRLISVWSVFAYTIICISEFLIDNSVIAIFCNLIFCVLYFASCYFGVALYYKVKEGGNFKRIVGRIGLADVIIGILVGSLMEPQVLIVFFCISFIGACLIHVILNFRRK